MWCLKKENLSRCIGLSGSRDVQHAAPGVKFCGLGLSHLGKTGLDNIIVYIRGIRKIWYKCCFESIDLQTKNKKGFSPPLWIDTATSYCCEA